MNTRAIGDRGEQAAARFLQGQGWQVVVQNFRGRRGEVDIIALDGDTWVFIEVKTRNTSRFGTGRESVDVRKQRRIAAAAEEFLARRGALDAKARFDVIECSDSGKACHITNAFECK